MDIQAALTGQGMGMTPMDMAPTSFNPGGFQPPSDPAAFDLALCVRALKEVAQKVSQDDDRRGNELDAIANKVNRILIERKQKFEQAMETLQGRQVQAQM